MGRALKLSKKEGDAKKKMGVRIQGGGVGFRLRAKRLRQKNK